MPKQKISYGLSPSDPAKPSMQKKKTRQLLWTGIFFLLLFALSACHIKGMQIPEANSKAAQLYRQNCTWCHALPHPHRHSPEQWRHVMQLMQQHRKNRGMPKLPPKDYQEILDYLVRHARK